MLRAALLCFLLLAPSVHAAPQRLAVLEFEVTKGLDVDRIYFSDLARSAARKQLPGMLVMTRESSQVLLKSQGKTLEDCVGTCEVETGKLLGADYVISGRITKVGSRLALTLKLHDTANANLLGSEDARGKTIDELLDSTDTALTALLGALAGPAKVKPPVEQVQKDEGKGKLLPVASVDVARAVEEVADGKTAKQAMHAELARKQSEVNEAQTKLVNARAELEKAGLSGSELQRRKAALDLQEQQLKDQLNRSQGAINEKETAELARIIARLRTTAEGVADSLAYSWLFDRDVALAASADATAEVVTAYDTGRTPERRAGTPVPLYAAVIDTARALAETGKVKATGATGGKSAQQVFHERLGAIVARGAPQGASYVVFAKSGLVWARPALEVTSAVAREAAASTGGAVAPLPLQGGLALVDVRRVLQETSRGKEAKARLAKERTRLQAEIDGEQVRLTKARDLLEKQGPTLSAEALAKKTQEWQASLAALQARFGKMQSDLAALEATEMRTVLASVTQAVQDVAQKEGVDVVAGAESVVRAPRATDLTNEVIRRHDERFPASK